MSGEMFRGYVAEHETCWFERLSATTARVCNVPEDGEFNIDDVVTVAHLNGNDRLLCAAELVSRALAVRVAVRVPCGFDLANFAGQAEAGGMKAEPMIMPMQERRGLVMVAAKNYDEVVALARQHGAEAGPNLLR